MRVLLFIILLTSAFISAAQQSKQALPSNPEFKRFVFEPNQKIVLKPYDSLYFDIAYEAGDNWVFKFDFKAKDVVAIADDEFSEMVIFQIPPVKGNSFTISEEDFAKAQVIYGRSCFCKDSGPRLVQTGTIKGKRVSKNRWLVTFELDITPRPGTKGDAFTKKFKGYFNPGTLLY